MPMRVISLLISALCLLSPGKVHAAAGDYNPPASTDGTTHTVHGIHDTNAACKAAGDGTKSNWENNVGHTGTWPVMILQRTFVD